MNPELSSVLEALLFAADAPVPADRLAELLNVEPNAISELIAGLNRVYTETGRAFRVNRVARGYQLYTLPEFAEWVRRLYENQHVVKLSRAAHEVLAVIAYNQPITRPEIERLRGVDSAGPLVTLLERGLIVTAGRARKPGAPLLYRTTREFLRYFGLDSLDDLPRMDEISAFLAARETPPAGEQPAADVVEPDSR